MFDFQSKFQTKKECIQVSWLRYIYFKESVTKSCGCHCVLHCWFWLKTETNPPNDALDVVFQIQLGLALIELWTTYQNDSIAMHNCYSSVTSLFVTAIVSIYCVIVAIAWHCLVWLPYVPYSLMDCLTIPSVTLLLVAGLCSI